MPAWVFYERKSLVWVWAFPTGERAQELCIAMSDGHKRGEPSFYGYGLVRAVPETGCARLQNNPENRPTSLSHGQAGYCAPFTG